VKNSVDELVEGLMTSYVEAGGINHVDGVNLPSKTTIAQITQDLLRLLFPGFFDDRPIHGSELRRVTDDLLRSICYRLQEELVKSLEYSPPSDYTQTEYRSLAAELARDFLAQLPKVRALLRTDSEAAYNGDPAALSEDEVIVAYPCIEAIAVQRLAHELYQREISLIPRIMTEWAHSRTGIDLHPGARIGSHFFIDHGTGTVVGETAKIGNHVKMYQGVGLVARSLAGGQQLRGKRRHPTIEDSVTIYAGATIVGGETVIGEGSTIGANVFLLQSVPPRSLVVFDGLSMKVVRKELSDPATYAGCEFEI
jgi:serine O-acetyltransferase